MENSNEILIVGDLHGRSFWRKVVDSNLPVVFLGDYHDPYPHEGITEEESLKEFKDVVEFAKTEPDRVRLLLGNHMLHYVGLSDDTCRLDWAHRKEIYKILKENESLFLNAFKWKNTLFTHAGVTKGWLQQRNCEEDVDKVVDFLNNDIVFTDEYLMDPKWSGLGDLQRPIGDIGRSRGGYAPYGSPAWADLTEMYNGSAFKDSLTQIVGHTQLRDTGSFYHKDNFYCCDSRAVFIWDGNNLKLF